MSARKAGLPHSIMRSSAGLIGARPRSPVSFAESSRVVIPP